MRDFRLVMVSLDPDSNTEFVIYVKAINEHYAIEQANKDYEDLFEVDRHNVTEIIKNDRLQQQPTV